MSTLPRRDRWVIACVVVAIAALIAGFAASVPGFTFARASERSTHGGATETDTGVAASQPPAEALEIQAENRQ